MPTPMKPKRKFLTPRQSFATIRSGYDLAFEKTGNLAKHIKNGHTGPTMHH